VASRAIVLFARTPAAEAAAKRLNRAVPLFRELTASWIRSAPANDAALVIACDAPLARIASDVDRIWIRQRGASFGERLANAADDAFALGFDEVLVAGIDAPPHDVAKAFAALQHAEAAIAPSPDGGVNLIALKHPARALLESLRPRQRDVAARCIAAFESVAVLTTTTDIDSIASIDAARHEIAWRPYRSLLPAQTIGRATQDHFHPQATQAIPARAPPPAV
jgi:glycosyltransferase A (GT-A) superfamily protein (DUF2064 family)